MANTAWKIVKKQLKTPSCYTTCMSTFKELSLMFGLNQDEIVVIEEEQDVTLPGQSLIYDLLFRGLRWSKSDMQSVHDLTKSNPDAMIVTGDNSDLV